MNTRNIICTLFFLLTVSLSNAQKIIGKVIYNATVEETKEYKEKYKNQNSRQDKLFRTIEEEGKKFNLELVFSNQNSFYQLIDPMYETPRNEYAFKMAKIIYKAGNKYYYSVKEKVITKEIDFLEKKYLIENKCDISDWKILNKQEKIGKYVCYLAEREHEYQSRKGKVKVKQTVWYTPEIHFPFGPSEFVGFPGLVLKVKSGTIVYRAKTIKLNVKEKTEINTPKENKRISQKEFDLIAKKARENLIKG